MAKPIVEFEPRYTPFAIFLHWLVAFLILAGFIIGLTMVDMKLSPTKLKLFSYHKWLGVTVLLLAMLRLGWRWRHPAPLLPATMPRWQRISAQASHVALYLLLFVVPLSGWLYSSAAGVPVVYLGLVPLPDLVASNKALADTFKNIHHALDWTLLGVVVVHAAAALKHHVIDRDDLLRRMLPRRRRGLRMRAQAPQDVS